MDMVLTLTSTSVASSVIVLGCLRSSINASASAITGRLSYDYSGAGDARAAALSRSRTGPD
jgi:hypothetical protein